MILRTLDASFDRCKAVKNSPSANAYTELLEIAVEEWKEQLVDAEANEIEQLRGAIKNVRYLLKRLDEQPTSK